MNRYLITLGITAVLAIISVSGSFYTVDQGELGVVLRNGKIVEVSDAGLSSKVPFIDDVKYLSTQTNTVTYKKLSAYSKDQQPAELVVSVTYAIQPSQASEVYANYGDVSNLRMRVLDRQVPAQVENVFGQYTAISAVQERIKLGQGVTKAIMDSTASSPLNIVSVQIENIDFSDAYEKSVEDRMRAEVEVQTQKQNLEKERVSAEIAVTKAQAVADSNLAQAKAEAEAIRLKGDAEATAIKARASALAQNANLVELVKAERWDGRLPTTVLPSGTLPFIETGKK